MFLNAFKSFSHSASLDMTGLQRPLWDVYLPIVDVYLPIVGRLFTHCGTFIYHCGTNIFDTKGTLK